MDYNEAFNEAARIPCLQYLHGETCAGPTMSSWPLLRFEEVGNAIYHVLDRTANTSLLTFPPGIRRGV